MDSQRWLVLILLGTSLGGVIAYLIVLGRRLTRLKQILAQSPREPEPPTVSVHPGKKGPASARRSGAAHGLALAQEAEWAEDSIATQRPVLGAAAPTHRDTGASLLERSASAPAAPTAQGTGAGSTDGDLLKKLLTFDSDKSGDGSESQSAIPVVESPRPAAGRSSNLLGMLGSRQAPASPEAATATGKPPAAPDVTMERLGAFMANDVGAPESAKVRNIPVVTGPSFSLGGAAAVGPNAPARLSPLELMKGAVPPSAGRDRGVPVSQVLGDPGRALSSLLGGASRSEPAPTAEPSSVAEPPPVGRDSSIMGRLGGLSSGSSRLSGAPEGGSPAVPGLRLGAKPAGEAGSGSASPLSSLMGRLGSSAVDGSPAPFTLDSLKSASAERGSAPAAGGPAAGLAALRKPVPSAQERPAQGATADGALQRLSQLSRMASAEPSAPVAESPGPVPAAPGVAGSLAALSKLSLKPPVPGGPGAARLPGTGGGASPFDRLKAVASTARPAETPPKPAPLPAPVEASGNTGVAKKKLVLNFKTLGSARAAGEGGGPGVG